MIVSMTGYGQGVVSEDGTTVTVEVRTVNHRFLDLSLKLPRVLQPCERLIKDRTKETLTRGRVYITMQLETEATGAAVRINESVMAAYLEQLRTFGEKHGIETNITVRDLVSLPESVSSRDADEDTDAVWPLADRALVAALKACHAMRCEEGETLARDLSNRMKIIDATVAKIEKLAPGAAEKHAEALRERVARIAGDVTVDPDRMTTEISLLAERLDFTEELTRLRSHESQFNNALKDGGEVSKRLTYLLQEMHREASTIGAKASDADVIGNVVTLKEETEKLREQVQNIE